MATKKPAVEESQELAVVPDYLKNNVAPVTDMEALTSLSNKIPRISLKGRKFRIIVEGEEIAKPTDSIDVVILAVEPGKGRMVKTYYEKGYSSGDTEPPTCSSADGVKPDSWIGTPKHSNCAGCSMNAFGSATSQSGKPAKACRDSKRLSVAIPENDSNEDLGLGMGGTVFTLGVPVTSLGSLSDFGKLIAKNGYPLPAVIVKLDMVDTEFPQIEFGFKGFLPESEGLIAISRNIERDWMDTPSAPAIEHEKPAYLSNMAPNNKPADENVAPKTGDVNSVVGNWD